jgi:uncharacterized protein (DUF1330 family)
VVRSRLFAILAAALAAHGCGDERGSDDDASAVALFAELERDGNAYVIADVKINDFRTFNEYFGAAPPTQQQYGGEIVYRSRHNFVARGGWRPDFLIVERWRSPESFREWRDSPENKPLKRLKFESASYRRVLASRNYRAPERPAPVEKPDPARAIFAFADTADFVEKVEGIRETLEPHAAMIIQASRDVEVVEGDWSPRALVVVLFFLETETVDWLEGEPFAELDNRLGDFDLAMCHGMTPPSDRVLQYFTKTDR